MFISYELFRNQEFGRVIVPHVDAEKYQTEVNRSMPHNVFTCGMNWLTITHTGKRTSLIVDSAS